MIVAVAASSACPQKRWFIEAQGVPPLAKDTTVGRTIVVTASREPEIEVGRQGGGGWLQSTPVQPTTWPGTGRYVIPRDAQLGRVAISKSCGAGCNECIPPHDGSEYIRIDAVEP